MCNILLISDIHHGNDKNYPKVLGDKINQFGGALKESESRLKQLCLTQHIDFIMNLGDLIADTRDTEKDSVLYREGLRILRNFGKPVFNIAGNHDVDQQMSREIVAGLNGYQRLYYAFEFGGYTHIALDGNREGKINGEIILGQKYRFDAEQITWLERTLQEAPNKCLVYCHFPIDDQDISSNPYWPTGDTTRVFPQNYEKVRDILEKSGKVLAYFSGHTHFSRISTINGILHGTVGSFSENNGLGEATKEIGIARLSGGTVSCSIQRL